MKKIDIHCHLLPGMDDGSASERMSLKMIAMAQRQGIKSVIATPHWSTGFQKSTPEQIRNQCRRLEEKAKKELGREFHIYPGQEIMYRQDVVERLDRQQLLTMGGSRFVLVEFMPGVPYSDIYRSVRELLMAQYIPILAHIERYSVLREKGRVEELIDMGAYMQMNYRRIGGKWYEETTRWCRKMLREENIHFLGTDMHNTKERRPETEGAEIWMKKHLDEEYRREIMYKNALRILKTKSKERKQEIWKTI